MSATIGERRLLNQHLTGPGLRSPAAVVARFGAMQAQEYEPARWAVGLRLQDGIGDAEIQRAFDQGQILRTHVMRPTWHFVTPADIRWLLHLTAPRVHRILSYYNRALELDARTLTRGTAVLERALGDGRHLTRAELGVCLQRVGLPGAGDRLARVVMHAELEGIICSGPRRERQFTYALLADRASSSAPLARDEALATLARRFFSSHGPATVRDFVWWSGLTTADAKRALDIVQARREEVDRLTYWTFGTTRRRATRNHLVHLLPIYDEYFVAYRDRLAVPHRPTTIAPRSSGWATFQHAFTVAGQVAGTRRAAGSSRALTVRVVPLRRLKPVERRAVTAAVRRYALFRRVPVDVVFA